MTWNHRVLRRVYKDIDEEAYAIHEVFYDDDGLPYLVTEDAVGPYSETLEGLVQVLEWMRKALSQPILEYSDFEEGGKYYQETEELIDDTQA